MFPVGSGVNAPVTHWHCELTHCERLEIFLHVLSLWQAEEERKDSLTAQHVEGAGNNKGACIHQLPTRQTHLWLVLLPVHLVTVLLRKQSTSLPWLPSPWLGFAFSPRCRQPFNTALEKGRVDEVAVFKIMPPFHEYSNLPCYHDVCGGAWYRCDVYTYAWHCAYTASACQKTVRSVLFQTN